MEVRVDFITEVAEFTERSKGRDRPKMVGGKHGRE